MRGGGKSKPGKAEAGGTRLAIGAAALAWAPIGFVGGGAVAVRTLAPEATEGGLVVAACVLGAGLAAALMAAVATRLPPKPLRIVTVVAGGVSFALVVYLVRDFVADRLRAGEAFDVAYARMTPFRLRLESNDGNRRPFSALTFDATTRTYAATRPGGWLCRGTGAREHTLALARALQDAKGDAGTPCDMRVAWRYDPPGKTAAALGEAAEETVFDHSACAPAALLRVADAMIKRTERRASCRRL